MTDASKRNLIKALGAAGGITAAPTEWTAPLVNSVLLPAHAQTTCLPFEDSELRDLSVFGEGLIPDQTFSFNLNGAVPAGPGVVTVQAIGDLGDGAGELWTILLDGDEIGATQNTAQDCQAAPLLVIDLSQQQLTDAIQGGSIVITAVNGGEINAFCTEEDDSPDTLEVTLTFPTCE